MRAKSVQRVRAVAFAVVRASVVVMVATGVWLLVRSLTGNLTVGLTVSPFQQNQNALLPPWLKQFLMSASFSRAVALIAVAVPLALLTGWITRFVFRPPSVGCPRCAHEIDPGVDVCPECGQRGLA